MTRYQKRFQKLCSQIAKVEGKKRQVRIGDVREIVRILIDDWVAVDRSVVCETSHLEELGDLAVEKSAVTPWDDDEPKKKKRGKK